MRPAFLSLFPAMEPCSSFTFSPSSNISLMFLSCCTAEVSSPRFSSLDARAALAQVASFSSLYAHKLASTSVF